MEQKDGDFSGRWPLTDNLTPRKGHEPVRSPLLAPAVYSTSTLVRLHFHGQVTMQGEDSYLPREQQKPGVIL